MHKQKSAALYRQLDLESQVAAASPQQLISLLYAGAIAELKRAQACEAKGEREARIAALSKTIDILNGLSESLSFEVETELPYQLQGLYVYMIQKLLSCQQNFDAASCVEVQGLLEVLADGWKKMKP